MAPSTARFATDWDFNLVYKASDKNSLNLNRRLMGKFRAALHDCELMEIKLQNRRFTWSNEREKPTLVWLDRTFCRAPVPQLATERPFELESITPLPDHSRSARDQHKEGCILIRKPLVKSGWFQGIGARGLEQASAWIGTPSVEEN
jgi:hypothetical protein